MQRIERYGVIALVFLLVTILAVAVWGQRKNQSLMSFLKRDKSAEIAQLDAKDPALPLVPTGTDLDLSTSSHDVKPVVPASPSDALGNPTPLVPLVPQANPDTAVHFDTTPAPGGAGFIDAKSNPGGLIPAPQLPLDPIVVPADKGPRTYKVKSGDTLGSIAQHELGSSKRWKELESLNGVKAERLSVGMVLNLPSAGAAGVEPQAVARRDVPETRKAPAGAARTYSVRSGDSLSKIAAAQLGDASRFAEIQALNPGLDPRRLSVGQTLRLPEGGRARQASAQPKARSTETVAKLETPSPKKARVQ